jgi:hypothetical protein
LSRASVAVLFPDGEIRYALYQGGCDRLMPRLFVEHHQAWDADNADTRAEHCRLPEDVEPGSGEPVTIYCDYGDGSVWQGTATRDYITSELNFLVITDYEDCNFEQPRWVKWK